MVFELVEREGFELPEDVQSEAFQIRDGNDDEALNVSDALSMVNKVLGRPVTKAVAGGAPAGLSFGSPTTLSDGRTALPVVVDGSGIAGVQVGFAFDPSKVELGVPVSAGGGDILLESQLKDGVLQVIAVSLTGQEVAVSGRPAFYLPVRFLSEEGRVRLNTVILADRSASVVSLTPGVVGQTVSKQGLVPRAFSLSGNRPNPFNPSTEIGYEVSEPSHVRLVVYNLLGQEIARLVDGVQAAGRYSVRWDGKNATGQTVSSGVYVYRLVAGTGYTESKRMTLLK